MNTYKIHTIHTKSGQFNTFPGCHHFWHHRRISVKFYKIVVLTIFIEQTPKLIFEKFCIIFLFIFCQSSNFRCFVKFEITEWNDDTNRIFQMLIPNFWNKLELKHRNWFVKNSIIQLSFIYIPAQPPSKLVNKKHPKSKNSFKASMRKRNASHLHK